MLDLRGRLIRLGDQVAFGTDRGVVVFSLDTDEFAADYPKQEWAYLGSGIMVLTERSGLVFLDQAGEQIEVIS